MTGETKASPGAGAINRRALVAGGLGLVAAPAVLHTIPVKRSAARPAAVACASRLHAHRSWTLPGDEQGAQIVTGNMIPPDFATFWSQAAQQNFHPKIVTIGKALLFPSVVNSLGPRGDGLSSEIWWTPNYPFKSGLTGQGAQQLTDEYTNATKRPWSQPIGYQHALFEVVLKRTKSIDAKSILDAIVATNYDSIVGPVHWTGQPVKNVSKTPLVAGQWQRGGGAFALVITANKPAPEIPVGGKLELLS